MTKKERIQFLEAFVLLYEYAQDNCDDKLETLSEVYTTFVDKETLPSVSADELILIVTDYAFCGDILEVRPRYMLPEEWDTWEDFKLPIDKLYRCGNTGWSFILTLDGKYIVFAGMGEEELSTKSEAIKWMQKAYDDNEQPKRIHNASKV